MEIRKPQRTWGSFPWRNNDGEGEAIRVDKIKDLCAGPYPGDVPPDETAPEGRVPGIPISPVCAHDLSAAACPSGIGELSWCCTRFLPISNWDRPALAGELRYRDIRRSAAGTMLRPGAFARVCPLSPYIRSGAAMPKMPRAFFRVWRVALHIWRRAVTKASFSALSTGQSL